MMKIDLGIQQLFHNVTYSCLIETEVPENVDKNEFKQQLKDTLETIREVMQEDAAKAIATTNIKALPASDNINSQPTPTPPPKSSKKNSPTPASPKQLSFVKNLCNERGLDPAEVAKQHGVESIGDMSGQDCWKFINYHTKNLDRQ